MNGEIRKIKITVKTGTIDMIEPEGAEGPNLKVRILGIISRRILKTIFIPIVKNEKSINLQKSESLITS